MGRLNSWVSWSLTPLAGNQTRVCGFGARRDTHYTTEGTKTVNAKSTFVHLAILLPGVLDVVRAGRRGLTYKGGIIFTKFDVCEQLSI